MAAAELLDCGHERKPSASGGTAHVWQEVDGKRIRICYECADEAQRKYLLADKTCIAYLTVKGDFKFITTWTGGFLMAVTKATTSPLISFGQVSDYYKRWHVQAVDVHGQKWYGTGTGEGGYVRMRITVDSLRNREKERRVIS